MRRRMRGTRERMVIDRATLGLIAAGVTLALLIGFPYVGPYFIPAIQRGPTCSDLASPLGGNNRSVLSYKSSNPDAVDLDLELEKRTIIAGEALQLKVTFINQDKGPVILHLPRQFPIITDNVAVEGVTVEITRVAGGGALNGPGTYQSPAVYTAEYTDELHLLGSRARCSESYTLNWSDMSALGMGIGDYRIRVFYRNNSPGNLLQWLQTQPVTPTATPYPEYQNSQGVWTGNVNSEEIRFSIVAPGSLAP